MIEATMRDIYLFNARLGLRRIIGGIDYFRLLELPLVVKNIATDCKSKILDVGCGSSRLPSFLLYKGCEVYATDIDDNVIPIQTKYIEKLRMQHLMKSGKFKIEMQDVRNLSYPDNYFDRVIAVSTLEHIPNDGDSIAVKEMSRVLKRGGRDQGQRCP